MGDREPTEPPSAQRVISLMEALEKAVNEAKAARDRARRMGGTQPEEPR